MLLSKQNDTDCHQVQLPAQIKTSLDAKWKIGCKRKTSARKEEKELEINERKAVGWRRQKKEKRKEYRMALGCPEFSS